MDGLCGQSVGAGIRMNRMNFLPAHRLSISLIFSNKSPWGMVWGWDEWIEWCDTVVSDPIWCTRKACVLLTLIESGLLHHTAGLPNTTGTRSAQHLQLWYPLWLGRASTISHSHKRKSCDHRWQGMLIVHDLCCTCIHAVILIWLLGP